MNSTKNFTCPSGKLRKEFISPVTKSTSRGLSDTTFFARCLRPLHVNLKLQEIHGLFKTVQTLNNIDPTENANLLKRNTSCHKLDHVSGFDYDVWIPSLPCCANCHASLNNIQLTLYSLKAIAEIKLILQIHNGNRTDWSPIRPPTQMFLVLCYAFRRLGGLCDEPKERLLGRLRPIWSVIT